MSIVSQREINHDISDYLTALRAALREAPDVVLVGEMRDLETIKQYYQLVKRVIWFFLPCIRPVPQIQSIVSLMYFHRISSNRFVFNCLW